MNEPPEKERPLTDQMSGQNKSPEGTVAQSASGVNGCRDPWIEQYFPVMCAWYRGAGSDQIAYLLLVEAARDYGAFRATCATSRRREAWRAVQVCCAWLAQRKEVG